MKEKDEKVKGASLKGYGLIFKTAPLAVIFHVVFTILRGLSPTAIAIFMGLTVDAVIDQVGKMDDLSLVFKYAGILCALMAYQMISKPLLEWLSSVINVKLEGVLNEMIIDKHTKLKYWRLEDNESLDLIKQVDKDTLSQFSNVIMTYQQMFIVGFTVVSAMITITRYVWWIVPVTLVIVMPLLWLANKGAKKTYEEDKSLNDKKRYVDSLDEVLLSKEAAKERYLFDYSDHYNEKDLDKFMQIHDAQFKVMRDWFIRSKAGSVVFSFIVLSVAIILLQPLRAGLISFGIYSSLIGLITALVQSVGWTVPQVMDGFTTAKLFFNDFFKFMSFDEEENALVRPNEVPNFESIEFKNVYFTYPGTDREILKGMSFRFDKGRHYSLVGANGSGKSTVIKLMLGLYDNYDGEILINGVDARTIPLAKRRAYFSAIFQDYTIFGTSIRNNIAMGYENREAKVDETIDDLDLRDMVNKLPDGIETEIGKLDQEGADLSGGQRQRIALARAVVSDSPVIVLDEPTAAMDPTTESKLYHKMGKLTSGRTTVFISHRLGSTSLSDEIFLFKDGKVYEHGTHGEMMALEGDYFEMYNSQKEWYL